MEVGLLTARPFHHPHPPALQLLTTALSFPSLRRQTGQEGETPEQVNYNNKGEEN